MDLMQDIIARAKADKQRIVLPEGTEERTLKAADQLLADGVADIILIGNPAEIKELAAGFGLNHIGEATLVDPKNHEKKAAYADLLFQLRQKVKSGGAWKPSPGAAILCAGHHGGAACAPVRPAGHFHVQQGSVSDAGFYDRL